MTEGCVLKLMLSIAVCAALTAGPALAQGTFNNGRKPSTFGSPSSQATKPAAPKYGQAPSSSAGGSRTYGTPPAAPGYKPYEGYKASSVYSSKPQTPGGARPCETSVYVNACKDR